MMNFDIKEPLKISGIASGWLKLFIMILANTTHLISKVN